MKPGTASVPVDPYEPLHGTTAFGVDHYDLDLTYRIHTNRLSGTASLRLRTREAVKEVSLDLVGLTVERVTLVGAQLARYTHRGGSLVLRFGERVPAQTPLTVVVRDGGTPTAIQSPWGPVGWE